MKLGRELRNSK